MEEENLNIYIQFGGGPDRLFEKVKKRIIQLPPLKSVRPEYQHQWTMREFLLWMKEAILRGMEDLILEGDTVKPGILVLINDVDWKLYGELEYALHSKDTITFVVPASG